MKRYLAAIAALMFSTSAHAANVGDTVQAEIICIDQKTVADMVTVNVQDKGYERVRPMLAEAVEGGVCRVFPGGVPAPVVSVGKEHRFTDSDGDNIFIQVIEIKAPSGTSFWSLDFRILGKGA